MQGLSWPLDPIIGQVFKGFAYNGRAWTKAKPRLTAQWTNVWVITSNSHYVPADNLIYAIVECFGPGGGGGWATLDVDGVTGYPVAAGGGGSGGYSRSILPAEAVIQGADVVIGQGGLVGVGQIGGGTTATPTNFGGIVIANGGGDAQSMDGTGAVSGAHGAAGIGAPPGVGDVTLAGASGGMWSAINVNLVTQHLTGAAPGLGGQLFGGAQWPARPWIYTNVNGINGLPNSGAGGGGAQVNTGSTPITMFGGAGGSGLCIVTEICGTDDGGGPEPPEPPGPGRPPGVDVNLNVRARVADVPADFPDFGLHPMPVEGSK